MGSSNEGTLLDYDGFKTGRVSKEEILARLRKAEEKAIFTGVPVVDQVFGGILPRS